MLKMEAMTINTSLSQTRNCSSFTGPQDISKIDKVVDMDAQAVLVILQWVHKFHV